VLPDTGVVNPNEFGVRVIPLYPTPPPSENLILAEVAVDGDVTVLEVYSVNVVPEVGLEKVVKLSVCISTLLESNHCICGV